jgi:hypothetical protein
MYIGDFPVYYRGDLHCARVTLTCLQFFSTKKRKASFKTRNLEWEAFQTLIPNLSTHQNKSTIYGSSLIKLNSTALYTVHASANVWHRSNTI